MDAYYSIDCEMFDILNINIIYYYIILLLYYTIIYYIILYYIILYYIIFLLYYIFCSTYYHEESQIEEWILNIYCIYSSSKDMLLILGMK